MSPPSVLFELTFPELKTFLLSFNVAPGVTITFDKWDRVMTAAHELRGGDFSGYLMDCFEPSGERIDDDEDSPSAHFTLTIEKWDDFEKEWGGG